MAWLYKRPELSEPIRSEMDFLSTQMSEGVRQVWLLTNPLKNFFYYNPEIYTSLPKCHEALEQAFFHRFCGIKKNRISETLSLGEKKIDTFNLQGRIKFESSQPKF